MRRTLICAALGALVWMGSIAGAGAAAATEIKAVHLQVTTTLASAQSDLRPSWAERFERVRYRSLRWPRSGFSVFENQLTVHAAAVRFGINEGRMICIVTRETGGTWNEFAYNASSGASGLFQHLRAYWSGRVDAYRAWAPPKLQIRAGVSPFNARANVLVSARMMAQGLWSHWGSSC